MSSQATPFSQLHPATVAAAAALAAVTPTDPTSGEPTVAPSELNHIEGRLSIYLHEAQTRYEADVLAIEKAYRAAVDRLERKFEADVSGIRATWSAFKANWGKLTVSHLFASLAGSSVFAFVKHFL